MTNSSFVIPFLRGKEKEEESDPTPILHEMMMPLGCVLPVTHPNDYDHQEMKARDQLKKEKESNGKWVDIRRK